MIFSLIFPPWKWYLDKSSRHGCSVFGNNNGNGSPLTGGGGYHSFYSPPHQSSNNNHNHNSGGSNNSNQQPQYIATNECRLIDYRGHRIAAFLAANRQGEYLLCLPQAFELFLKHLVGGLHTVYTKLKVCFLSKFLIYFCRRITGISFQTQTNSV